MSASCPPSTRSTSASTVASPQSSRCSPRTHRSPGCVTACSGSAGASSSSVRPDLALARQQPLQLALAEADQPEVEAELGKVGQLEPQQRLVPAGVQRQLVVRQHIGALLRLAHVRELDHRHPVQSQLPCRQHPAMTGDDAARTIDQHRIGPAELPDTRCDLRHLGIGVGARVAGIGDQLAQRPPGDLRDRPSSEPHKVATNRRAFQGRNSAVPPQSAGYPPPEFRGHTQRAARPVPAGHPRSYRPPPRGRDQAPRRSSAPATLARGLGVMAAACTGSASCSRPRTGPDRHGAARRGRPPSPTRARPAA